MIAGLSRFKVANGFEAQVKDAFLHRPHLVDHVPGFLGMETFTEEKDGTAFYLLTRWTDAESFRAWHASPAHHASHRGIPKGLKLDPTFTKVWVLDRLVDPAATERSLRSMSTTTASFSREYSPAARACISSSPATMASSPRATAESRTRSEWLKRSWSAAVCGAPGGRRTPARRGKDRERRALA
jgi:heme-degrading monooxygenase HmoA